jgi:hypothetical protein
MQMVNYLAVLVCSIVAMIVGSIWYGPLFGKMWMKIAGGDMATMSPEQKAEMKKGMGLMYFTQFVLSFITAYVLDGLILNFGTASGLWIAIFVWFGFVMTTEAGGALWSGKPKKIGWNMFLISTSGHLVTFILMGLILSAWH